MGSPASRGAVASVVGAGRACLAAASAVSASSAAIAASITMAGTPQRRVATVDRAVMNRFTAAMSRLKFLSALASVGQVNNQLSINRRLEREATASNPRAIAWAQ
jgi:hypothetical protein